MASYSSCFARRHFIQLSLGAGGGLLWMPGAFAEALTETPRMTEGPFYPDKLPLDTDNDLLIINDSLSPAVGEITYLTGHVRDSFGNPIQNAFVEIWQVDSTASYIHSRGRNREGNDSNFQGYGRFLTDSTGKYYFRTIKPVPYPGRTPHIHLAVSKNGKRILTTQMLVKGHPQNESDGVFRGVRDQVARETILVDFKLVEKSMLGELQANFDVVIGKTAFENEQGQLLGEEPKRR